MLVLAFVAKELATTPSPTAGPALAPNPGFQRPPQWQKSQQVAPVIQPRLLQ